MKKITLRLDDNLAKKLTLLAEKENLSINQFLEKLINIKLNDKTITKNELEEFLNSIQNLLSDSDKTTKQKKARGNAV